MAGYAYPTTAHNARAVTPEEYERLMYPAMPDGLAGIPSDPPLVYADGSGMTVRVRADRAGWLRGLRWESGPTELTISIAANGTAGTTRKDLIVLRMSRNPWDITVEKVQGVATATPVTPSATYGGDTSTGVWELPLAVVTVPAGDTAIEAVQVTPLAWYVGEDGQILCTDTTRPPHHPGRSAFETNTGRRILSDGTKWTVTVDDSGISSITLEPGWTAALNRAQRRGGSVVLALNVRKSTTMAADSSVKVGKLPAGFLPTFETPGSVQYESSAGLSMGLRATTAGDVYIDTPVGVTYTANRPLVGSLVFHAA